MAILFIRTLIIFATLIVLMRILGKRQMRELELSELVVSVMIADLAATPLQDIGIPLLNGIIPIVTLFACELVISGVSLASVGFRSLMYGRPSMIIKDGLIQEKEMRSSRLSIDELLEQLRSKEILDIASVKYAILETDGTLSTILMPADRPVSARQMNAEINDTGYPIVIIEDGVLLNKNLDYIGKNEKWLHREIKHRGGNGVGDVFIMVYYDAGKIYFSLKGESDA